MVRQLATRLGDKLSVNAIAIGDEDGAWLKRLVDLVSDSRLSATAMIHPPRRVHTASSSQGLAHNSPITACRDTLQAQLERAKGAFYKPTGLSLAPVAHSAMAVQKKKKKKTSHRQQRPQTLVCLTREVLFCPASPLARTHHCLRRCMLILRILLAREPSGILPYALMHCLA